MWIYLELAVFVIGFFLAYRAGWKNGWSAAFHVCYRVIEDRKRELRVESLKPKKTVEPSALTEEEKQPLDN
jgi:hypothetical protein